MTSRLGEIVCACLGALFAAGAAFSQTAVTPPGALAPEAIQPWGLPPPPGVGLVELFADIHDAPQGKFLEGGAFDTDGNFWFVAARSGSLVMRTVLLEIARASPHPRANPGPPARLRLGRVLDLRRHHAANSSCSPVSNRSPVPWPLTPAPAICPQVPGDGHWPLCLARSGISILQHKPSPANTRSTVPPSS